MDNSYFYHLIRMAIASAICTAMIGFGLFARRRDRSRRWLFVLAGFLCSAMTAVTIVVNAGGYPGNFNPIIAFIVGITLLLPALPLIIIGRRGRRIGDHPHCRECGFDLFGKPPESTRCSECGADLANPKSVVIGIHHVRRRFVLAGLFLLILGLMVVSEAGRDYASRADLYRFLPTWWLLSDLDSPASHNRAEDALRIELSSSNLSHAHAQLIAERVLKHLEAGRPDDLLYQLLNLIDQQNLLDEITTRRVMRQIAWVGIFRTPTALVRGRPIELIDYLRPAQAIGNANQDGSMDLRNLNWKRASSTYQIGQFVVPASEVGNAAVSSGRDSSWDEPWIDPADDWSKILSGGITVSRQLTLAATLKYHGRLLEETSKVSAQCFSRVCNAREAAVALIQPTRDDLAATWSATVCTGGPTPQLRIDRSLPGSRVFARAAIIDAHGRHEIGIATVYDVSGIVQPSSLLQIPKEDFKIELVPAPVDAGGRWNTSAILNQTILITAINHSSQAVP